MDSQKTTLAAGDDEFRLHQIASNGITLHVAEMGSGPVVLFCHGFPAIWSGWRSQIRSDASGSRRGVG